MTRSDSPKTAPTATTPSLWTNPDYLGWWTGNTISAFGTSISHIAYPLLVLYITGSVAQAGVITAADMIGTLMTTLWGGALADRVSRKAIMVVGPLIQAATLGAVAFLVQSGRTPVLLLAGTALVSGMASGLTAGAATPALRRIVPKEQLGTATSREMGRDMVARLIGAPVGGALFSISRTVPFLADAISFLFSSLGAALIRRPLGPDRVAGAPRTSVLRDIGAGFRFVASQPYLRFVVIWVSLLNVVGQGFFLLFIALVRFRGGGPTTIGAVTSVALIGGIAGAVIAPIMLARLRPRRVLYTALWTFVACLGLAALVPQIWQIGAVLLVAMFNLVPLNVVLETYLVRLVPDEFIGRVSAVTRFGGQSLQWLGPLFAGVLADAIGIPGATLALMAAMIPLALAIHVTRSLGVLDRPVAEVDEVAVPRELESASV